MSIDESKQELRAQMQEQLRALDAEDRRGRSLKICSRVLELPVWKRARVVVVFEPFRYEPEIAPLIADLRWRGCAGVMRRSFLCWSAQHFSRSTVRESPTHQQMSSPKSAEHRRVLRA